MEDQPSWKSHTFTLMVFGGIVVLCAIFFTLGMLVGRTQSQKTISVADGTKGAAKDPAKDERPELTFYDSVDKKQPQPLDPLPPPKTKALPAEDSDSDPAVAAAKAPAIKAAAPTPPPAPIAAKPSMGNFQINAFAKSDTAEKLVNKLKGQGFHAFMLDPMPGDPKPLYRVQVGPVTDQVEADSLGAKLKAAGYSFILKQ